MSNQHMLEATLNNQANKLIHKDRRLGQHPSAWVSSFCCADVRPLIICRGPIRKETMDIFSEMGISHYGILISEKDSVTYANALAPELRTLTNPDHVHRITDYTGASKEERQQRIAEMIEIAHRSGYNSIFAGYGFMSEDAEMVRAVERAGLTFIGPSSSVQAAAGLKDEAKRTALQAGVSVTPGVNDATARALLHRASTSRDLLVQAEERGLSLTVTEQQALLDLDQEACASALLERGHEQGLDLYSLEEMTEALSLGIQGMFRERPTNRVRLKAISGGGGKGQRILNAPSHFEGTLDEQINAALEPLPALVREVLAEVKCLGVGDNKNVVAELNIEETSHQEIQVVGNGDWCLTLGGRDCSLQMHEQKLVEISVTEEELTEQINLRADDETAVKALQSSLKTLRRMEEEATRFGLAVGLNSVSTFECIVSGDDHFFMEMNTRIQVEHRVTELCYEVQFSHPDNPEDSFVVSSLVELMVLIARHGSRLPKPTRIPRCGAAVEVRINATNDALKPHAGGVIQEWSPPLASEVRDDQGISSPNPDTGAFMRYHLAGAYDSNIALLLTVGGHRHESYEQMAEVLRLTKMEGDQLCSNLHFHYGLIHWLLARDVYCRPNTRFVAQYLSGVGALKTEVDRISLSDAWVCLKSRDEQRLSAQGEKSTQVALVYDERATLVMRPLEVLLKAPHLLAGWLCSIRSYFTWQDHQVVWTMNPLYLLSHLYHFLNLERREQRPALQQIWSHDEVLLDRGLAFYDELMKRLDQSTWIELSERLASSKVPDHFDDELWQACRASHQGHQAGLGLLTMLVQLATKVKFFDLDVDLNGRSEIPEEWQQTSSQAELTQALAPPPPARSGELVAVSGGMFYPREAPDQPKLVEVGDHFEEGQPLYIIEVMKMFNKVYAPFSGTITSALVEGEGVIIKKGQPIFEVKPDIEREEVDPLVERAERLSYTRSLVTMID